jgi:nitrogen fixation-related uncharacterized protein
MQWLDTEQYEDDKKYVESMTHDAIERWFRMTEAENKRKNANTNMRKFAFANR